MKAKRTVLTLAAATMLKVLVPTSAHAQSTAVVTTPVQVATPITAEKNVLPNPPLLVSGLTSLAIGYAPAYLNENSDGIRSDFPRIPLPASREGLEQSAAHSAMTIPPRWG